MPSKINNTALPPVRRCKVLISGAGIAGLTLALALEKHGIEYTLLEAYPDIVAKAGAGICLLPNGLRILDQLGLGVYEELCNRAGSGVLESLWVRDERGEELHFSGGWEGIMKERYGYCGLWIDRPTLLATLYDRIGDKSRLLAGKRVAAVAHFEDRVVVTTGDGEVYEGDILVGADGEHSRVREEMVRLAGEMGGGVNTDGDFDDEKEASATYACLFAHSTLPASHPSTPLPRGLLGWNLGKDYSYVLGTGPGNRVYWLLSKKMDKTCYGSEIPKITEEEKEKIVSEHWNDALTPILKMGELFESRNVLVCTPLREIVYKKTGLGRIGVLGDAGHKMLPIIAQGGNQAIESVAAFTNALVNVLSSKSKTNPGVSLSASEVESVFDTVREARAARVDKIVAMGQQRQKMDTMATPELEVLMREKFPGMMPGIILQRWDDTFPGSVELEGARMGNLNGDAFVDAEGVLGVASLEVTTQPQA